MESLEFKRGFGYVIFLAQIILFDIAGAAGLAVYEQSASGAARGLAGAAAVADDASTVFYNPAGMTRLRKNEAVIALGNNFPSTKFDKIIGLDATGGALSGSSNIPNPTLYVPSAFGVWAASQDLRIGVGLNAPFGQNVKYNEGWVGRYFLTDTKLKVINLSGTAALRLGQSISIGGGIDYQDATLGRRTAIDFGSGCFGALGPVACTGLGLLPQSQDGSVNLDLSSRGVGYNLGILFEPREGIRLGATYRSKITHNFSGTAAFAVPATAAFLTAGGAFKSTGASTQITLPEIVSIGASAEMSPRFTLLAGLIWARSSRFDNIVVRFANPAQPTVVDPQNWKNTYRPSLGFDYKINRELILHGGIAFDQSPIPAQFRQPYLPDTDSLNVSTGLTWKPIGNVSLTASYSHVAFKSAPISQAQPTAGMLIGTFKRDFNVLGLQAGLSF